MTNAVSQLLRQILRRSAGALLAVLALAILAPGAYG
jgi:hypothetical protein